VWISDNKPLSASLHLLNGLNPLFADSYQCNFGRYPSPEMCGMTQSGGDEMDWHLHHGATESEHTGPPSGHSTGEADDAYLYLEASDGMKHYTAT
jgi:hypothetical protein